MAHGTIKDITTINIMHHTNGADTVYIKHPDLQEMVQADALYDLGDFVNMLFSARAGANPGVQECLDRAKILYTLKKTHG